jgi:hypothetical protein
MKKRTPRADADILRSITELNDETEWSDEELDSYLRENGVDALQATNQIRASVAAMLQNALGQEQIDAAGLEAAPIESLAKEGEARGLSIAQLAKASGMSLRLFAKLQLGMLRYASIPFEVFVDIGRVIGRTAEEVGEYVRFSRPDAHGAHFKAGNTPIISEQMDFFVAVEQDDSLIPEHRERFLALEVKYKNRLPGNDHANTDKEVSAMNQKENRHVVSRDPSLTGSTLRDEVRGIADKFADAFKEIKRRGD